MAMPSAPKGCYTGHSDVAAATPYTADAALAQPLRTATHWHCSTLSRSFSGATWLQQHLNITLPLQPQPNLCEQNFGAWEGQDYNTIYAQTPHAPWHTPEEVAPPQGESFAQVCARVAAWHKQLPAGNHVVVAHAGVIRAALAWGLGLTAGQALRFSLGYGSLTHLHVLEGVGVVHFVNRPFLQ